MERKAVEKKWQASFWLVLFILLLLCFCCCFCSCLDVGSEVPDTNGRVGVTGVERVTVRAPGQGDGLGFAGVRASEETRRVGRQFGDEVLAFEVPNLDAVGGGSAQPVAVGGEGQSVDDASGIEGVQRLVLDQVPQVGGLVATTRSTERTIRRNCDRVEVTSVAFQVLNQLAVSQAPNLDLFVPSTRHNNRVGVAGREFDTAGPESVVLLGDGEFALTKSVPQTDGTVSRSRNDLTVVGRESDAEDFFGVSLEAAGCGSGLEIPQTEGVVPRSGQSKKSIGRDDNILDEVRVTGQGFARITVVSVFVSQVPNEERSISGSSDEEIGIFGSRRDRGDPSVVGPHDASEGESFVYASHDEGLCFFFFFFF